ncbi:hypothetical protein [Glutamicibacter sp. MCAF14]|uniref:hypothetical protein n=1 Tax=Glutamicibacter sp. MCAF14 TaxID=3233043 RepID=UPI003F8ECD3A
MSQLPTVGRIVQYKDYRSEQPLAAIITSVFIEDDEQYVNLTVFEADGSTIPRRNVRQAEQLTEYYWSWPAR